MAYANSIRTAGNGISGWLAAAMKSMQVALVQRRMYSQTFRELYALTDRELSDLGIHRTNIRRIAVQAAYGK